MEKSMQINTWYTSQFEIFERSLNGEASSPLHNLRKAALGRFRQVGFPTTRDEEWRFTNVAPIARAELVPVLAYPGLPIPKGDLEHILPAEEDPLCLVFVDGHLSNELSRLDHLPAGITLSGLADGLRSHGDLIMSHLGRYARIEENGFTALNTAFLQDGAFLSVDDGVTLERPVHLIFLSTRSTAPYLAQPRNLILAGKNARLSIVEHHAGFGKGVHLTNSVTEMAVGDSAAVELDLLQEEGMEAYHIGTSHVHLGKGSSYTSNAVSFGGALVRKNETIVFDAEGGECVINGLVLATGKQHVDTHTVIDHAKPHCSSHELVKSILDGKAKGVFNGKIYVRKDAQKTNARQTNKTLLLSDDATIDTKPQLEIFADDVKCTHGATIGQLDEEQLFYLRTRGIDLESARDLLTYGFASDVINRVGAESVRRRLAELLRARLRMGRIAQEES